MGAVIVPLGAQLLRLASPFGAPDALARYFSDQEIRTLSV